MYYLSLLHYRCKFLAIPTNIGLGQYGLLETNTLADLPKGVNNSKKSFATLSAGLTRYHKHHYSNRKNTTA